MRKKILYLASMVLVFSAFVGIVQTQTASATSTNTYICHSPQPGKYNKIPVSVESYNDFNGHDEHSRDIIPPIQVWSITGGGWEWVKKGHTWKWEWVNTYGWVEFSKNWNTAGQAIWHNNCQPIVSVSAIEPVFVDPTCEASGSYKITAKTGVVYKVNGTTVGAGTYPVEAGESVTVTAVAASGYALTGQTEWSHEFVIQEDCVEEKAVINYGVVCGADGATVTLTNTGNIAGDVTLNGEVISVGAGATVNRVIDTGKDGLQITIVVGEKTVYDQLVDCDKSEVLGVSTVATPTALPRTSGNSTAAAATIISGAGVFVTILSFAVRRLLTRGV